jgi:hypothetical protein
MQQKVSSLIRNKKESPAVAGLLVEQLNHQHTERLIK